jgi:uncharacterized protein YjlB
MNLPTEIIAYRFEPAGTIPNNPILPLVGYIGAFRGKPEKIAQQFEDQLIHGGWRSAWRWGVYDFPHFHSTAHEVLGCYRGAAKIRFGHSTGITLVVQAGDVVVIPAGVGHQNLESSPNFHVVGGYPEGQEADLLRGDPNERPEAEVRIASVPLPTGDPVFGTEGPLFERWGL